MSQMFFDEIEAARIAQTMETNGLAFYERAAAATRSPAVRDVFLKLAQDEQHHLATFKELEAALEARGAGPAAAEDEDQADAYIHRLLQSTVFCDKCAATRLSDQATDDLEALAIGMRAERDSIFFYGEMLEFVDSKEARQAFTWIREEERKHLAILAARSEDCSKLKS
jgi:rubrerythrin